MYNEQVALLRHISPILESVWAAKDEGQKMALENNYNADGRRNEKCETRLAQAIFARHQVLAGDLTESVIDGTVRFINRTADLADELTHTIDPDAVSPGTPGYIADMNRAIAKNARTAKILAVRLKKGSEYEKRDTMLFWESLYLAISDAESICCAVESGKAIKEMLDIVQSTK